MSEVHLLNLIIFPREKNRNNQKSQFKEESFCKYNIEIMLMRSYNTNEST